MQEHKGATGLSQALLLTRSGAVDAGMLFLLWMQLWDLWPKHCWEQAPAGPQPGCLLLTHQCPFLASLPPRQGKPRNYQWILNEAGGSGHPLKGSFWGCIPRDESTLGCFLVRNQSRKAPNPELNLGVL